MCGNVVLLVQLLLSSLFIKYVASFAGITPQLSLAEVIDYRNQIESMFDFAYGNYIEHAWGHDELKPISCTGHSTWGDYSLTLVDSLDTLAIMGKYSEFRRIYSIIADTFDFNRDVNKNVSVFESNIRVVGGLLSGHMLARIASVPNLPPEYPCKGPLLKLAEDLARKLLPAFNTKSGMPFGTVNLGLGVPESETPITCTAGVGTFVIEFSTLSRLTGDAIFENTAMKAIEAMHTTRSRIDLLGNHINTTDKKWTAIEAGIGGGIDSFFEYLVKGAIALHQPRLMDIFYTYYDAINQHVKKDDWFFMVHKDSGHITVPAFQSLESFWPGLLTLIGETHQAKKSLYNYHSVWKQFGFMPEMYDVSSSSTKFSEYPLRPEYVESLFYLYRATLDPHLLLLAAEVIESIESSTKVKCGYATVMDVNTHQLQDRMESFFLAETLKYLYLLFTAAIDEESKKAQVNNREESKVHFILNSQSGRLINVDGFQCVIDAGGYVFNTEAHPIDVSILDCCKAIHEHKNNKQQNNNSSPHQSATYSNANQGNLNTHNHNHREQVNHNHQLLRQVLPISYSRVNRKDYFLSIVTPHSSEFAFANLHHGDDDDDDDTDGHSSNDYYDDGDNESSSSIWPKLSSDVTDYDLVGHDDDDDSHLYHKNNCDFDLLTCPIESRFSRYIRYGQVG